MVSIQSNAFREMFTISETAHALGLGARTYYVASPKLMYPMHYKVHPDSGEIVVGRGALYYNESVPFQVRLDLTTRGLTQHTVSAGVA
jgi:hypothetical protein